MTTPFLVTKSPKSIGIALLLTFLFGPIGLLYASISGGLIMTLTPIIIILFLYVGVWQDSTLLMAWQSGLILIFIVADWFIMLIWAVIGVKSYNQKIETDAKKQFELWDRLYSKDEKQIVIDVNREPPKISTSGKGAIVSSKPSLQEWAKSNPGKSINDYYSKYGK
jgi:hypothetical protein